MIIPGGGRLAYAAAAKTISVTAKSGVAASAARETIKSWGRFGLAKNWRKFQLPANITDAALRAKVGRTNFPINSYGGGVVAAGGINTNGNNCR